MLPPKEPGTTGDVLFNHQSLKSSIMKYLVNPSPSFILVKEGKRKKDFMNLKVTIRGTWNEHRRFI